MISYIVPGPQFEILGLLYTFYESRDKCCGFLGTWKNVFKFIPSVFTGSTFPLKFQGKALSGESDSSFLFRSLSLH